MTPRYPTFSRKMVLEAPDRVADGAGGYTTGWVAMGELWAEVKPVSGRDRASEFATVASVQYRITVRAAPQDAPSRPKPEQRFVDGARIFLIRAVTEADFGARYLTCYAEEEVSQ